MSVITHVRSRAALVVYSLVMGWWRFSLLTIRAEVMDCQTRSPRMVSREPANISAITSIHSSVF